MNPISIQVILVLYGRTLDQSPAYKAWSAYTQSQPGSSATYSLMVCDNTPGPDRHAPEGFAGTYLHQPDNPGLARSYNHALHRAESQGATWLLLLDQDTEPTADYWNEVEEVASTYRDRIELVAAVPKLVENGIVQSPHCDLTTRRPQPLPLDYAGFPDRKLHMYNSGALMRVSSLRAIGGFPEEFWLDFLDHATFHLLRRDGGKVLVMHAVLHHELSTNAPVKPRDKTYLARHRNVLEAEFLFYRKFGTPKERWWYRRRLIHTGLRAALRHRLFRIGWRTLMVARRVRIAD